MPAKRGAIVCGIYLANGDDSAYRNKPAQEFGQEGRSNDHPEVQALKTVNSAKSNMEFAKTKFVVNEYPCKACQIEFSKYAEQAQAAIVVEITDHSGSYVKEHPGSLATAKVPVQIVYFNGYAYYFAQFADPSPKKLKQAALDQTGYLIRISYQDIVALK